MRKLATLFVLSALGLALPTAAQAAPVWSLDIHHHQTNFAPGGTGEYWFDLDNIGPDPSSGTITLTINLPKGLTRNSVREAGQFTLVFTDWSCPGSPGATVIVCTTNKVIPLPTVDVNPAL